MNHQLALEIKQNQEATFEDFCWGENTLVKEALQKALAGVGEPFIYLWGKQGSGKSHLLQACCHAFGTEKPSLYLPLETLKTWDPLVLREVEMQDLFCIDEVDAIAGLKDFEEALFHLYNRIRDNGKSLLVMAGHVPPQHNQIQLPDLRSRLSSGLVMPVQELSDSNKIKTLQVLAQRRSFELSEQAAQYLVNRSARNMHDLQYILDQLDDASLAFQRKITIPFIKSVLNW